MFDYRPLNDNEIEMLISLPEGKEAVDIVNIAHKQISSIEPKLHGKEVYINGRLTTGLAMYLGHRLAHITRGLWIYDPRSASYYKTVWH